MLAANGPSTKSTLEGPKSYQIPLIVNPQMQPPPPANSDEWAEYDSHKHLEGVNLVEEYAIKRKDLPLPPGDLNPKV